MARSSWSVASLLFPAFAVPASCNAYVADSEPDASAPAESTPDASVADLPLLGPRVELVVTLAEGSAPTWLRRGDGSSLELRSGAPRVIDLSSGSQEQFSLLVSSASGTRFTYLITLATDAPRVELLKSNPARVNAYLGQMHSVAVSPDGTVLAAGAQSDDPSPPDGGLTRGACTVFQRNTAGAWSQTARVEGAPQARLGYAVALSDDSLAVGSLVGAVSLYQRDAASFDTNSPTQTINGAAADLFGSMLDFVADDLLLVGARAADQPLKQVDAGPDGSAGDAAARLLDVGAVHTYRRDGTQWLPLLWFQAPEPHASARFGQTFASDGTYVAVGAPNDDHGAALTGAGRVFVYRIEDLRAGAPIAWGEALQEPQPMTSAGFGSSLAMYGDRLLVGAPAADQNTGRAFVYRREASGYVLEQQLTVPAAHAQINDRYGSALAFGNGGTVAFVAAHTEGGSASSSLANPDDDTPAAGAVFVFERTDQRTWVLRNYLKPANVTPSLQFGVGVHAFGNALLAAGIGEASASDGGPYAAPRSGALFLLHP